MEEKAGTNCLAEVTQNNINAILSCPFCTGKVRKNRMCPKCSQLFCEPCIVSLSTQDFFKCPSCSEKLKQKDLLECRFIYDIFDIMDKIPKVSMSANEKCSIHNTELKYYCIDCEIGICSDCAILTSLHKGHSFDHINNIYEYHQEIISQESETLNQKIAGLNRALVKIDSKIESCLKFKAEEKEDLNAMLEKIQARLDLQLEENLQAMYDIKDKVYDEITSIEMLKDSVEGEIMRLPRSELIAKSPGLIEDLKKFREELFESFEIESIGTGFYSELVPEYITGIFVLPNYKEIAETTEIVYSDIVYTHGVAWRLKLYPNGNGTSKGNFISVFLELVKGMSAVSKYQYKIEMKNHKDNALNIEKEFISDFEEGECWGYNRFFRIDLLEEEEFLDSFGTLVIKFYIRPCGFQQLVKDQIQYINEISKSITQAKKKAKKLTSDLKKHEIYDLQSTEKDFCKKTSLAKDTYTALDFDCLAESKEGINFESQIPPHHMGGHQIKLPDFNTEE